jgi:hypothetical protein
MAKAPATGGKQSWRRPRLTLEAMMLIAALAGVWLAWTSQRLRRVAIIDLEAPDIISVGDRQHTLASFGVYIRNSRAREAVIRSSSDMPFDSLMRVVKSIEAAGIHEIRFSPLDKPPSPSWLSTQPAAKGDDAAR